MLKDNNIVTLFDGFAINSTNKTLPTSRGYSLIESRRLMFLLMVIL